MNPPKCDDLDYIHFLIAAQKVFTCTEAARCQPEGQHSPAHDAFTRLLRRQPLDTEALWQEWSLIPCDFRVYDKPAGGQSKNAHFQAMLQRAKQKGFAPEYVLMDSWYSGLENLKWIRDLGWLFLTRLKSNRLVNPDGAGNVPVSRVEVPAEGRVVHLRGFGFVKVFQTVSRNGDVEYWATNDLGMSEQKRAQLERQGWGIEVYHRALKQCCGVEKAQVRKAVAIVRHLLLALRAFLGLKVYRLRTGVSWYEAKLSLLREAIRTYLAHPTYDLNLTA